MQSSSAEHYTGDCGRGCTTWSQAGCDEATSSSPLPCEGHC